MGHISYADSAGQPSYLQSGNKLHCVTAPHMLYDPISHDTAPMYFLMISRPYNLPCLLTVCDYDKKNFLSHKGNLFSVRFEILDLKQGQRNMNRSANCGWVVVLEFSKSSYQLICPKILKNLMTVSASYLSTTTFFYVPQQNIELSKLSETANNEN